MIFAKFGMIITGTHVITEKLIRAKIDKDNHLRELESKFGFRTMLDKVRTLRKQFGKEKFTK